MPRFGAAAQHALFSSTHTDVNQADTPADNEVLTYDSGSGQWDSEAAPGAGGGEANTASNQGAGGVGVFKQKTGVDLEFKNLNAGSSKVTITDDTGNDEVDIDLNESDLTHTHAAAGGGGTVAHSDTSGIDVNDHHNRDHASSHSDGGTDELDPSDMAGPGAAYRQYLRAQTDGSCAWDEEEGSINFIIDGGGSAITTGEKGHVEMPFAFEITGWSILADQSGSIVVDVWADSYANFPPTVADTIAGSEKPTLSTAQKNQDLTLTTWTPTLAAGDILAFNVDSVSTVTRVTVAIRGYKR